MVYIAVCIDAFQVHMINITVIYLFYVTVIHSVFFVKLISVTFNILHQYLSTTEHFVMVVALYKLYIII